jgi:hypothetical protein
MRDSLNVRTLLIISVVVLVFLSLMKRYLCALARHNKPDRNHREKEYQDIPS